MATALYPGSFDPVHRGHVDVVEQAVALFGSVVVVVMHNPSKPAGLLSVDERVRLISESVAHLGSVTVERFDGLAVDATRRFGADFIAKGLRTGADFEVEQQMAQTNWGVAGVRTVFLPCNPALAHVSSRFVREIAQYGGDVSSLVPAPVADALARLGRADAR